MDKIWYRNPSKSEVIGRCDGDEKTNDYAEPTKSQKLKKSEIFCFIVLLHKVVYTMWSLKWAVLTAVYLHMNNLSNTECNLTWIDEISNVNNIQYADMLVEINE